MQQSSSIATATRTDIWPCRKKVKGDHRIIIWTDLVDFVSPILYTKIQAQTFLEKILRYGMVVILFNSAEPF